MIKNIIALLLAAVVTVTAAEAQITYPVQQPYELTAGMKGVKTSTDVVALALPAATLVGVLCARDWQGLLQGVETAAVTAAFTYGLKYACREERPDRSDKLSFPSGHTAVTFATATFITKRYGWKLGIPAYILGTYTAWGRCYSRQHYVWDCLVGAAIGAGSALIFTTPFAKKHDLTIAPTSTTNGGMGIYASFTF